MTTEAADRSVIVRRACADDVDRVLALVAGLGRPAQRPGDGEQRAAAAAVLGRHDTTILLAERDRETIGVASLMLLARLNFSTPEARLLDLYVVPDARRSGIAQTLLQIAIEIARCNHCHVLRLECGHGQRRREAHRLYERAGFIDRGRDYQLELR